MTITYKNGMAKFNFLNGADDKTLATAFFKFIKTLRAAKIDYKFN